jgi:hypothetical protein
MPRDFKDSPYKCYSFNSLDHLLPDRPTGKKYLKEKKAKKESQQKSNKKEYFSMASGSNFSPIKISIEEE